MAVATRRVRTSREQRVRGNIVVWPTRGCGAVRCVAEEERERLARQAWRHGRLNHTRRDVNQAYGKLPREPRDLPGWKDCCAAAARQTRCVSRSKEAPAAWYKPNTKPHCSEGCSNSNELSNAVLWVSGATASGAREYQVSGISPRPPARSSGTEYARQRWREHYDRKRAFVFDRL